MSEIICELCPHHCRLKEGQTGICRVRYNRNGVNTCGNYGKLTSLAMDPIEKKPLYGFHRGSMILSAGSFGCNLACPFCQNHEISMHGQNELRTVDVSPEQLRDICLDHPESIGVAFTYNEPMLSWEYILDCAELLRTYGKQTVLVTNGCFEMPVLEKLIPVTDAVNIDLKGDESFYRELRGDYAAVRSAISYCIPRTHTEVTILIVPGKNDSDAFIEEQAQWLASLDPDTYLHITRYFPRYRYTIPPAEISHMKHLRDTAKKYLRHVYLGNVWE